MLRLSTLAPYLPSYLNLSPTTHLMQKQSNHSFNQRSKRESSPLTQAKKERNQRNQVFQLIVAEQKNIVLKSEENFPSSDSI